jgi:hypothetical protein
MPKEAASQYNFITAGYQATIPDNSHHINTHHPTYADNGASISSSICTASTDNSSSQCTVRYSLRPIILFANVDVSRHILMIDTSVLPKSNMGRREYLFSSSYRCKSSVFSVAESEHGKLQAN